MTASFIDTGLTNGTTYFYKVSAVNAAGEGAQSSEVSATPTAPAGTAIYQINCGGGAVGTFAADSNFIGGSTLSTTNAIRTVDAVNPAPAAAYQNCRTDVSSLQYRLTSLTPGGTYKLRLHFAEIVAASASNRSMKVFVNGTCVLSGFDPTRAAGGAFRAIIREFTVTADTSGSLTVVVSGNPVAIDPHPILNALELLQQ